MVDEGEVFGYGVGPVCFSAGEGGGEGLLEFAVDLWVFGEEVETVFGVGWSAFDPECAKFL